MSNIFISDIVGTGVYAVPTTDLQLSNADLAFAVLMDDVSTILSNALTYERAIAWVKDGASTGGGEGNRTFNCLVAGVAVSTEDCVPETTADDVFAAIRTAFIGVHAGGTITSLGIQEYNMVAYGRE